MSERPQLNAVRWRKSSYSGMQNDCLEIADKYPGSIPVRIPVRDSKAPHGPAIHFAQHNWSTFVTAIKRGDLPTT